MEDLKKELYNEIEEFRDKGHKFINGELNVMQFKHASGGFGVYAHKGGKEFMIRLRIPSGITNVKEMKVISNIVEKYGLDGIHLTTRQAIQLHGLSIDDVCDIMKEALDNDIYTRGSGGNYPRNVAMSPLAGVNTNEAFDVTPYCIEAGNYFLKRITTYKLPRKLKVSFSSSMADAAHCTVQDLGFLAVNKDSKKYFQIYIGGGLGQNPKLALKYPVLINPKEVLYYLEGMVSLFKAEGDYENRNKARVRYIVDRLGSEAFLNEYTKHVEEAKAKGGLDIDVKETVISKKGNTTNSNSINLFPQKQEGLYSVYFHPVGGQLKLTDLNTILNVIESLDSIDIRLGMTEGLYIRNLTGSESEELLAMADKISGTNKVIQSISCIGVPTCQVGLCNSQAALKAVIDYFNSKGYSDDVLPRIYFSGCLNSCGVHQIGGIGFTGKKKRVNDEIQECFTLFLGGSFGIDSAKLGESYGEILATEIPKFLYELAGDIKSSGLGFDEYIVSKRDALNTLISKYKV